MNPNRTRSAAACLGFGAFALASGVPSAVAAESKCGQAQVVSSGKSCSDVKVKFDLADCHDTVQIDQPVVTCYSSKSATARVRTGEYIYQVELAPAKKGAWSTEGPVQRIKRKSPEEAPLEAPPAPIAALNPAPLPSQSEEKKPEPKWELSGLLDTYYGYNFNNVNRSPLPTLAAPGPAPSQIGYHDYDFYSNEFSLNLAELTVQRKTEKVSFLVDLDFGVIADAEAMTQTGAVDTISKHIGQAIVSWTPSPTVALRVGKMASHMGYESIKAIDDFQYSRSFLFALGIPHWHVGMDLDVGIVPGVLTASAYLYNGWDMLYDNNDAKTVGARLAWKPNEHVSLTYNGIIGPEKPNDNFDLRQVHEGILTWSPSKPVSFALDFIYGSSAQELVGTTVMDTSWVSGFLDNRAWISPWYYLSYRLGFFSDPQGFRTGTAIGQTLFEGALTNGFNLADGLQTRVELRYDASTDAPYPTSSGNVSTQLSGTVSFLYEF